MFENNSHVAPKVGSERSFGITFAIVFVIIGLWPLLHGGGLRLWAFTPALVFLVLGLFVPRTLVIPNRLWFKFGLFLGAIVSPVVMGIVFFLVVTPVGLLMRLRGHKMLDLGPEPKQASYWVERTTPMTPLTKQF